MTAPQTAEYREIPLADLTANPLNLRRRVAGIDELADSIRAVGVLEPVLVTLTDTGPLIVAGHRRHAAAQRAGLTTVPCVVRHLDEAQIIQATLIENGQRENLTYLEEAEGLRRLMDLAALTVRDLATRVGRNTAYITGRLALLTLPEPIRAALDNATITLDTAQQITDLLDHPDIIDDLLDPDGHIDPDQLRDARAHVATEREAARLTAEAAAKALRLVDRQSGHRYLTTLDLSPAQQAAHRRQACHAVTLDRSFNQVRLAPLCTDPNRHKAPAPAGTPTADATPDQLNRAEFDRGRKRAAKARRAFLHHALTKRIKRTDATAFVLTAVLTRATHNDLAHACTLLGIKPPADKYGQKDWRTAVAGYATTDSDHLLKAALATATAWAENHISPHRPYDTATTDYIHALTALGYTPDPHEIQQATATATTPSEAGPDAN